MTDLSLCRYDMSSIFGIYTRDKKDKKVDALIDWNRAYGEIASAVEKTTEVALGCFIEKISDTAKVSSPVLKYEDGYAVVDAVIYNKDELSDLLGDNTDNYSDEELIIEIIKRDGLDGLKIVNGDFAGAFFYKDKNELVLFRDHLGIRPLFYYTDNNQILFSTDIRGIVGIDSVDAAINKEWLYKYTCGYSYMSTTDTEFEKIKCVEPASYIRLKIAADKVTAITSKYWEPCQRKVRFKSEKDYWQEMRRIVTDAVKIRADAVSGTLGAELSGGLDSGVIDILLSRFGRECVYYSWLEDPEYVPYTQKDSRLIIRDICQQENIKCFYSRAEDEITDKSKLGDNLKRINRKIKQSGYPVIDYYMPPYINAMTITQTAEFIRNHGSKVVFTGHGGDEGVSHRCIPYEMLHNHEYYRYLRYMWSTSHGQKGRIRKTIAACKADITNANKNIKQDKQQILNVYEFCREEFQKEFNNIKVETSTFFYDNKKYILEGGSRNRLDNMSLLGAYSGVRYLIPYLDYRVVDFALSIPRYLFLKGHFNRFIFRAAFKDIMPRSLLGVQVKEDIVGQEEDLSWYKGFDDERNKVVALLDRDFWKDYFDFAKIDEWLSTKFTVEEAETEYYKLLAFMQLAMLQNVIMETGNK